MEAPRHFSPFERLYYEAALRLRGRDGWRLKGRNAEIAALVARDLGRKQIARRLGIKKSTVDTHLEEIFDKLKIRSMLELACRVREIAGPAGHGPDVEDDRPGPPAR